MSSSPIRQSSVSNVKSSASEEKNDISAHSSKVNDHNSYVNSTFMNVPDAKWIQIYVNGDEHFSGCRCVINSRYYRNLDMFLNYLTERLKPSFGAVRNIYTPINGHPVHSLEDLISKRKYVVAGNERFKKLEFGYADVTDKKFKRHGFKPKSKFKVSKAKPLNHNTLNVYFHLNGNFKVKPNKVTLLSQDLENLELIFSKVRDIFKCGPIKRICTVNGKPVQSIEELTSNQSYVIVGKHEIFKNGLYPTVLQKNNSFSKEGYQTQRSSRRIPSVITARSSGVYSQTSSRSSRLSSSTSVNKHNSGSHQESLVHNSFNITEPGNGFDSLDSFKLKKTDLSAASSNFENKIKLNFDDDFTGIFRSKTQNHLTVGAVEVEDSSETVVDLPVDLLDAEEVEDEITPDMERSLQHLSLDVPEEIVAYLPSMQSNTKNAQNSNESQVSTNKYNLNHSQTLDIHNIYV